MKLFNTLTRSKEEFNPLVPGQVKIYMCGPTVYDYFHIGNARPFVIFDVLRKYLEYRGYEVNFVQNFTDIDDKMINKAREIGITVEQLAHQYISEYFLDADSLMIKRASNYPRATLCIEEIINFIKTLEAKGFAYNVEGDVYFSTKKSPNYGKLSRQPLDALEAGVRVEVDAKKKDAIDFVLWKAQKPGEPAWDSPWGKGRPGWHIECSAMANKYLGATIDIHCGGQDLIFPHHENEIAQSEAANDVEFVKYWLHNGHINIDNTKMSKSKSNFLTVREASKKFGYEAIRFLLLSTHYRNPINFSENLLKTSKNALDRIYNCLHNLEFLINVAMGYASNHSLIKEIDEYKKRFMEALDDDLNTAEAISEIFGFVSFSNKILSEAAITDVRYALKTLNEFCAILGIYTKHTRKIARSVVKLLKEREDARLMRDWKRADQIRDRLKFMGITVEDTLHGQKVTHDE